MLRLLVEFRFSLYFVSFFVVTYLVKPLLGFSSVLTEKKKSWEFYWLLLFSYITFLLAIDAYVCQIFFFSTKFKITLPPQNARELLEKKR